MTMGGGDGASAAANGFFLQLLSNVCSRAGAFRGFFEPLNRVVSERRSTEARITQNETNCVRRRAAFRRRRSTKTAALAAENRRGRKKTQPPLFHHKN